MITRIKKAEERELTYEEWMSWNKSFINGWRAKHDGVNYFGVYYDDDDILHEICLVNDDDKYNKYGRNIIKSVYTCLGRV